jgi:transcriptional regulator with XRE-family HTH domain
MNAMTARLHAVFVANVIAQMDELGMTRSQLARAMGVAPQKITQILKGYEGYSNPTLELLERFALALDTQPHTLLEPKRLAKSA